MALIADSGGSVQCFQGLVLGSQLDLTGATMASFIGCTGIDIVGAQLLMVQGGQVVSTGIGINNCILQGVDVFNAALRAASFFTLVNCNSWGQGISVEFPAGPPGPTCYFDPATKGNATNQAPVVTNGVGVFLGLPTQSISGVTTQEQVDSVITALVNLGLATDDR